METAAFSLGFDVRSDLQDGKHILGWNASPQTGPAYVLYVATHCVHIICIDSRGEESGAHRRSRNQVYVRSENVAGAKTSDDVLSTLADALVGNQGPSYPQPLLYRPGYEDTR